MSGDGETSRRDHLARGGPPSADAAGGPAPAFYALRPGGWRDYLTLLHPPYTLWHLSYVGIGWATGAEAHLDRLLAVLGAFGLAVGIGAHALDELNGRPLQTRIPQPVLWLLATLSIGLAVGIGIGGAARTGAWELLAFVAFGGGIVAAYNLELLDGRFHSDRWFAFAWGAFPALTASYAAGLRFTLPGLAAAAACYALSAAQRSLSSPVRHLRRRVRAVEGRIEEADGSVTAITRESLRAAPEQALRALSLALPLLATGLIAARLLDG